MAKDKVVVVNEGATYQRKGAEDGAEGARVVAFHVDRPRSTVLFAPLGSGREDRLSIDEFLDTYELIAEEGQPLPEDRKENEAGNRRVEKSREEALEANRADNPATRNTTRTDLDARAAARNER